MTNHITGIDPERLVEIREEISGLEILPHGVLNLGDVAGMLAEIERLCAALSAISSMGKLTLLGGEGLDPERAYQQGANAAFSQAAEIAEKTGHEPT